MREVKEEMSLSLDGQVGGFVRDNEFMEMNGSFLVRMEGDISREWNGWGEYGEGGG